ncbi:hypothetical protein HMPREF9120_02327 [Neisseria sp. oral taxon 020 str. F0370]|nr:hypothetical protein HMPREF9120_02327 [Neisseria sp. oral taxon 020 str. F0370]
MQPKCKRPSEKCFQTAFLSFFRRLRGLEIMSVCAVWRSRVGI